MGAENSKSQEQLRQADQQQSATERAVARALESQRRIYEEKLTSIRQAQGQQYRYNINSNQLSGNFLHTQTVAHTSTPLYPSLPSTANNNVQMTAAYASPSTPYLPHSTNNAFLYPPSAPLTPVTPTAASAPAPLTGASSSLCSPTTTHTARNLQTQRPNSSRNAAPHNKNAKSIVDCVTCADELGLQIYQCRNGHSSCKNCRMKTARCGTCSLPVTDMRNISLETTIAEIRLNQNNNAERIKCPNSIDGCCLSFKQTELDGHLKECPYKEIRCPLTDIFGTCTWNGKINQLVTHFNEVHQEHRLADVDKEMTLLNPTVNQKVVHLVNIGTFNFLVRIEVDANKKVIYMTVQLFGTQYSASKWTYELHVYNKRDPRRKYQYIDTCHSDAEYAKNIFYDNKCAVLDMNYAKTFFDNKLLCYKFYIKKEFNAGRNNRYQK